MTPFLQDADFTLYVGDALEVLRGLPDESVHCCVTSPPYWGLRDYGTGAWEGGDPDCDHLTGRNARNDGNRNAGDAA
jgi:DNA modification methylase